MTTPFPFVAGAVLTAAELNAITTLPINDQTDDYTLVVGDVGKRVIMNKGTANTVTVDDSIFAESDTIFIANKGAGTSTITAGAGVTINSASGLALVTSQSGQLVALSASSFLFVASDVSVTGAGLTKISTNTLSASASCIFTGLAAGTYRIQGALNASTTANILARFRESSTDKATDYVGYYYGRSNGAISGSTGSTSILIDVTGSQAANKQSFFSFDFYIIGAGTAAFINGQSNGADTANIDSPRSIGFGAHNISMTACDGINILLSTGTMTGQVTIYSYA
jgi:hypothetical protein